MDYCFEPLRARKQVCYCGTAACTYVKKQRPLCVVAWAGVPEQALD